VIGFVKILDVGKFYISLQKCLIDPVIFDLKIKPGNFCTDIKTFTMLHSIYRVKSYFKVLKWLYTVYWACLGTYILVVAVEPRPIKIIVCYGQNFWLGHVIPAQSHKI